MIQRRCKTFVRRCQLGKVFFVRIASSGATENSLSRAKVSTSPGCVFTRFDFRPNRALWRPESAIWSRTRRRFATIGRNLAAHAPEKPASQDPLGKAEQREQLGVVLCQAAVTRLAMLEQAVHDMETVLDFRAQAGLGLLQLSFGASERILFERRAHARAHRKVPIDLLVRVLRTFAHALVASVARHGFLATVQ
jgi:hypothetical protein